MSEQVSWEQELPVKTLPDDPSFRENYCTWGYDRERAIGFWIHMGRWPLDTRIWREQVLVYLPDGDFLVHRAWGYRDSGKGPSSALLSLVCEEPGRSWRFQYRGPARRTDNAELQAGGLIEGPQILLDLDLQFSSTFPVWDLSKDVQNQDWAKFHMEQNGRVTGTIAYDQQQVHMDGFVWRDHSRGPRELSRHNRHVFVNGDLPDNRSFAMTFLEHNDNGRVSLSLNKGVIWSGDAIYPASSPNPPFLEPGQSPTDDYAMTIVSDIGTYDLHASIPCSIPHTSSKSYNVYDGIARGLGHILCYEQGTIFTVEGQQFNGHSERSHLME
ncbi:MAG: hypothetical protein WC997_03915 [Porticoccaceae bacterium]